MSTWYLPERSLIKVSGADAQFFLQDLVTHDVNHLAEGQLVYSCLLTPQGRFLHDFFISRDAEGFYLECEALRRDDLIRRLNIFKLRAKVHLQDCFAQFDVFSSNTPQGFRDPRLPTLGYRFYQVKKENVSPSSEAYKELRIRLGIPEGSPDIKPEVDTLSDVNLDRLNAISWDKGCYVGQEVTARMNYRGLVKKRMVMISGTSLAAGSMLTQDGHGVGEIRSVSADRTKGLAILKLAALSGNIQSSEGVITSAQLPSWVT